MSIASVLIPSDKPDGAATSSPGPRYSLLLSTDPSLVEAAQRLRYDVFSSTPGFALPGAGDGQTGTPPTFCNLWGPCDLWDDRALPPLGEIAKAGSSSLGACC